MELYTIPPQDNYPQDWLDQLVLHETRHVAQVDALKRGITKLGYYILGEQAVGVVTGLVPRWFLEGDAVYSETMFSNTGRGRVDAFQMPYRTMVLSGNKLFSYDKALLGSYKDFVPDQYALGYPIVKMARDSVSENAFAGSLAKTAKYPFLVFPFSIYLKQTYNLPNRKLYAYTFRNLKQTWSKALIGEEVEYEKWKVNETKVYTNYRYPVIIDDTTVLVQKYGMDHIREYVLLSNGKEEVVFTPGNNNADRISVNENRVIWSENTYDLRWTNRMYSEIRMYNLKTKRHKRLTRRSWYFSPSFSPNGKYIVAIEETPYYESSLVILEASTGKRISRFQAPNKTNLQFPLWVKSNEIFCISVEKEGKTILKLDPENDIWEMVVPPTNNDISDLYLEDKFLIFGGQKNGVNNLFAYNLVSKHYFQLTHSKFGAFDPELRTNDSTLIFSEYTSHGYRIASCKWNPTLLSGDFLKVPPLKFGSGVPLNVQQAEISEKPYELQPYNRWKHVINIHSWAPFYFNYSPTEITNPSIYPGIMLLSQDILGTTIANAGVSYSENNFYLHNKITFKALFPVLEWSSTYGGAKHYFDGPANSYKPYETKFSSTFRIYLPLNLTRTKYIHSFIPFVEWKYNNDSYYDKSERGFQKNLNYINAGYAYNFYLKMNYRDIYPRYGISSSARFNSTPFENTLFSSIYYLNLRLYLPGLAKHHSLQLRGSFQQQKPLEYLYSSLLAFPRGFAISRTEKLSIASVDYAFPLFYPDLKIGPVLYTKRIRTNLFADYAENFYYATVQNKVVQMRDRLKSVGIDLVADINLFRIMFPIQGGARIGYLPDTQKSFVQGIFSINLSY